MSKKEVSVIFFIGNMTHSGGTERVLSIVANGLSERGFHVSIMSLWGKGQSFFSLKKTIKLYWIEERCAKFDILRQLSWLNHILKKEHADFLVDVDIILGLYSFFTSMRKPELRWISWEHFNYFYHFPRNHNLRKIVRRLVCRYADCLVVLTEEDRGYYCRGLRPRCPVAQIYNPASYEVNNFERKEQGKKIIFAAGRLVREKGFDLLISSWKLLEPAYPEWSLLIAGEGEERKSLEKEIKRAGLKNISLPGRTADMEELYRKAAFFVFPSRDEGLPMVLIEAMSFHLPVVSYSCRTGPQEIVTDGKDGFLVEPGHVAEFAGKMELLMQDETLRRNMGERAGESVRRFEAEGILEQWEALFGQLQAACEDGL